MTRWLGLARVVVRGAASDLPFTLAVWLLVACAMVTLVASFAYADAVATASLRRAIETAPDSDRGVSVELSVAQSGVDGANSTVTAALNRAMASSTPEISFDLRSPTLVAVRLEPAGSPAGTGGGSGLVGQPASARLTLLASYGNLAGHATLASGRWPVPGRNPIEATLSQPAAHALGAGIGDVVTLGDASVAVPSGGDPPIVARVVVVGIWSDDASDPYWLGDPLDLQGVSSDTGHMTRGPFLVAPEDLRGQPAFDHLDLRWRAIPSLDSIQADQIQQLTQGIAALPFGLNAALPGQQVSAHTGLATVLAAADQGIGASRGNVTLLTLLLAALAGYTVLLAAGMLDERRRVGSNLLRARGSSRLATLGVRFGEAVLLTVPAAVVALFAAGPMAAVACSVGPMAGAGISPGARLTASELPTVEAAALGCLLLLTLPSLSGPGGIAGWRTSLGRPLSRTLPQRLGVDVVLAVVAGIGLWQLHTYGGAAGSAAIGSAQGSRTPDLRSDPLLLAAPALGLVAGAVLATRLVPRLAELSEKLLGRGRGVMGPLVTRQVARRPLRYTRVAFLLVLAAAIWSFSVTYLASWTQSQSDQAAYAAGADLRAPVAAYAAISAAQSGSVYRAIPGVTAATPVSRESVDLGRTVRGAVLLSVNPSSVAGVIRYPGSGYNSTRDLLSKLAARGAEGNALAIPGAPKRLAVSLDVALVGDGLDFGSGGALGPESPVVVGGMPFPPGMRAVNVSVYALDADGRLQLFQGGSALASGANQSVEVPLTAPADGGTEAPSFPLTIVTIRLTVSTGGQPTSGTIELRNVLASDHATGGDWHVVPFDPSKAGWQWTRTDAQHVEGLKLDPAHPGLVKTLSEDLGDDPFGYFADTLLDFRAPVGGIVPVVASSGFLDESGAAVGDVVTVSAPGGEKLQVRIVAAASEFPSLDPATPFLVADAGSREVARFIDIGQTARPTEWWLAVQPGRDAAVAAALAAAPFGASAVVSRVALQDASTKDPIALGPLGALLIGSLGALALAFIGILASAVSSVRERMDELALLQAVGLSGPQLHLWLAIEQAFVLAIGLVAGSALGLVLAWLAMPFAIQGPAGAPAVPSPAVVVLWGPFVALATLAIGVFVLVLLVLVRQLRSRQVASVIRAAEG